MLPTLTVFTPTFNRAYTLHLCYESLKRQTCKDFIWLIIDDGSNDNTQELVETWISENIVPIRYYYQENQGMHGAHNTAYDLIDTELNVCIDSDDYMPDNSIEKIISFWLDHGSEKYAGVIGLDASPNGEIMGTKMPENLKASTISYLYTKYKVKGDKKLVYRSELTKKIPPYPIFQDEKYCPLSYKYILIDQEFPMLVMNEILCYVEYLPDGSSMNMLNQYKKNPKGFSFFRKVAIKYAPSLKERFRESVHYVSSSMMIKNKNFLLDSPCKFITLLAIPFGVVLFIYINNSNKKAVIKDS
jgi:glycosyltransferase involved in cell wall biosynthesis